ncbi:MAG TPA: SpoIIE family protein phosphatase [Candidatus Polarisedimenticolia bacterium]|nr:SpoIIE family protein phosphatase [Candidatus Polarisedimenticolia bacterium]
MDYLTIIGSDGRTFKRDIEAEVVRIGRSSKNDINLSFDLSLSRFHAEVSRRNGKFYVSDVGSRNGTCLNGKPVGEPSELKAGDRITLGETTILFSAEPAQKVAIVDAPMMSSDSSTVTIPLEDIISNPVAPPPAVQGRAAPAPAADQESRTLAVLTRAGMELINYRPLDEVLDVIMDLVFEAIPAERGFLMLLEGEQKELVSKVIRDPKKSYGGKISLSRSIAKTVVENRQSVLTSDAQRDDRFKMKESIVLQGIHSAMCVPLWNNREVIGLIYVDRIRATSTFLPEDLKLLTLLANIAAVKIENARLFEATVAKQRMEQEMQRAAEIQRNLLPVTVPTFPGYDLAGYNEPCREVGGDYFDFILKDDKALGLAIGDVSGKGMGAALLMATVRASFRAHLETRGPLQALIGSLNQTILQSSNANNFVSFLYAEVDNETGRIDYVNAGHNPPILIRASGEVERLKPDGLILGVFPGARYGQSQTTLGPGEMLVAYSDGVTETQNEEDEEFGEERLIGLALEHRGRPAAEIQKLVSDSLKAFAGKAPQYDDVTLIVLRRV